ncbi:MAG TPA: T9SS type A sorting domain-containing protein, partial [Chitinophagaceae bacterium]
VSGLQPGDYLFELTVTDDGSAIDRDSVTVSVVNNFRYNESLTIYPNPVGTRARVICVSDSTGDITLRVIDMNGRFVKAIHGLKGQSWFEQDMTFAELKPGTYYLEAIIGDKKRMIKMFVKN